MVGGISGMCIKKGESGIKRGLISVGSDQGETGEGGGGRGKKPLNPGPNLFFPFIAGHLKS